MLSRISQGKLKTKLNNIYKYYIPKIDIDPYYIEIKKLINNFNKKNKIKKKIISEKTSIVICYGDSVIDKKNRNLIKVFQNLYKVKLSKYFDTVHFLPFYPSSSDSGFAVKDHYKIDGRLGNWTDIKKFSKFF